MATLCGPVVVDGSGPPRYRTIKAEELFSSSRTMLNPRTNTFYYVGLAGISVGDEALFVPTSAFAMDDAAATRLQSSSCLPLGSGSNVIARTLPRSPPPASSSSPCRLPKLALVLPEQPLILDITPTPARPCSASHCRQRNRRFGASSPRPSTRRCSSDTLVTLSSPEASSPYHLAARIAPLLSPHLRCWKPSPAKLRPSRVPMLAFPAMRTPSSLAKSVQPLPTSSCTVQSAAVVPAAGVPRCAQQMFV
ncbi:hypothetical protein VPH35_057034 [Triticum aestivum]|uniref:Uncharacterized protein n=2 Tax=Triticum TaxID=4564 RepID=A0A9R1SAQ9_TRITD|nr:unnamed protein product [Triticum aestivum]VAH86752.1 unnamed protein product [Triticum turgidum subsp. durum]